MNGRIYPMILATVLAAGVFFFQPPKTAYACSCAESSVEERYEYANVIFTGTLASKDDEGGNVFDVDRVWKGSLPDGYVFSGFFGMCGTEFEVGESYLVYTELIKGVEKTGLCSGNLLLEEASGDIAVLDRLVDPDSDRSSKRTRFFLGVAACGAAILLTILRLRRRWKRN